MFFLFDLCALSIEILQPLNPDFLAEKLWPCFAFLPCFTSYFIFLPDIHKLLCVSFCLLFLKLALSFRYFSKLGFALLCYFKNQFLVFVFLFICLFFIFSYVSISNIVDSCTNFNSLFRWLSSSRVFVIFRFQGFDFVCQSLNNSVFMNIWQLFQLSYSKNFSHSFLF